jgi:hypothetical protein
MLIAIVKAAIASTTDMTVAPTDAMSAMIAVVSIVIAAEALPAATNNTRNNVDKTVLYLANVFILFHLLSIEYF